MPRGTASPSHRFGLLLAACAVLAAGVAYYRAFIRYELAPRNFGVVEPGAIYRCGRQTTAALKRMIEDHKIKTVVDLGAWWPDSREERQTALTLKALGVTRHLLPLNGDGTGDPNRYVEALRVLKEPRNHPVLVYCAAGAQRTSVCIVLYRHIVQGRSVDEAYAEARAYENTPQDNRPYVDEYLPLIKQALERGTPVPYAAPSPAPGSGARPGTSNP